MQTKHGEIKLLPGLSGKKSFSDPTEAQRFMLDLHEFSRNKKFAFMIDVLDEPAFSRFVIRWKPDPNGMHRIFDEQMLYNRSLSQRWYDGS